jgi:thiol-disulfide isomerase/thioredoxin
VANQRKRPAPPPTRSSAGTKTAPSSAPAAGTAKVKAAQAPQKSSKTPWLVGIGAAVVIIAAVAAFLGTRGGSHNSAPPGTSQTQPVTVIGTPLPTFPSSGSDPAVGLVGPTLEGKSFDGSAITIKPGGGTPLLLLFGAHWCPHCQRELPLITQWIKSGDAPKNLEIRLVSTAVSSQSDNYPPSTWLQKMGWPTAILADDPQSSAATAYGLSAYPFFTLMDGSGKVVKRFSGEISVSDLAANLKPVTG